MKNNLKLKDFNADEDAFGPASSPPPWALMGLEVPLKLSIIFRGCGWRRIAGLKNEKFNKLLSAKSTHGHEKYIKDKRDDGYDQDLVNEKLPGSLAD